MIFMLIVMMIHLTTLYHILGLCEDE